jgi:hypothetical protein
MDPTEFDVSQQSAGDGDDERLFPEPETADDARHLNDEIGLPATQAIGGLAGDPDSDVP